MVFLAQFEPPLFFQFVEDFFPEQSLLCLERESRVSVLQSPTLDLVKVSHPRLMLLDVLFSQIRFCDLSPFQEPLFLFLCFFFLFAEHLEQLLALARLGTLQVHQRERRSRERETTAPETDS